MPSWQCHHQQQQQQQSEEQAEVKWYCVVGRRLRGLLACVVRFSTNLQKSLTVKAPRRLHHNCVVFFIGAIIQTAHRKRMKLKYFGKRDYLFCHSAVTQPNDKPPHIKVYLTEKYYTAPDCLNKTAHNIKFVIGVCLGLVLLLLGTVPSNNGRK